MGHRPAVISASVCHAGRLLTPSEVPEIDLSGGAFREMHVGQTESVRGRNQSSQGAEDRLQ